MTCRNQLMNEGKPYPKSSCSICGSILSGATCTQGVQPKPGADPKYYVDTKKDVPDMSKYAVIYEETIYHEGDERSRTNPGHGYPAYSETVSKIVEFTDVEALKEWILTNSSKRSYRAIKYEVLKVATEITVSLS